MKTLAVSLLFVMAGCAVLTHWYPRFWFLFAAAMVGLLVREAIAE